MSKQNPPLSATEARQYGILYPHTCPAVFLRRPNRFIAHAMVQNEEVVCHVKNTGRCRELLIPGTPVILQRASSPGRKTAYDLISVWKKDQLVNIDSTAPNHIFAHWLRQGGIWEVPTLIRPETPFGDSRFDFYLEWEGRRAFVEVKGVTLEEQSVARFPDAPTLRGIKHLNGLAAAKEQGYEAYGVFIIQMQGVEHMEPNWKTHAAFGEAMRRAQSKGVQFLALDCAVTENSVTARRALPIIL